ncbi:MAG: hypothetical protein ACRC78_19420 [Planktothrix sp.]
MFNDIALRITVVERHGKRDAPWHVSTKSVQTHYPLPITHYPLPITHYPLPITHYPLPITHYPFPNNQLTPNIWDCAILDLRDTQENWL